jgi:hypothetical protein
MSHCPPSFTGASLRYAISLESASSSNVSSTFLGVNIAHSHNASPTHSR